MKKIGEIIPLVFGSCCSPFLLQCTVVVVSIVFFILRPFYMLIDLFMITFSFADNISKCLHRKSSLSNFKLHIFRGRVFIIIV